MPKRLSLLLPAAVIALALLAGGAIYVLLEAHRIHAEADALSARLDQIDRRRPVLRGEPTLDNAWDHYRRAFERFEAGVAAADVLGDIRTGARTGFAEGPKRLRDDGTVWLGRLDVLAYFEMLEAVTTHLQSTVADDPVGAGAALLDCAMMARDVIALDSLLEQAAGTVMLDHVVDVVADHAGLASWRPAQLQTLVDELAVLEGCLPDFRRGYDLEVVFAAAALTGSQSMRSAGLEVEDNDWMINAALTVLGPPAVDLISGAMHRLAAATEMPWPDALAALAATQAELEASDNPAAKLCIKPTAELLARPRRIIAKLRMLRQLAHVLAGGGSLSLDNPFGGRIDFADEPDRVRAFGRGAGAEPLWLAVSKK